MIDCLHTDDTDGHGGPQADGVGERESSEFKRNLNGGPQADGGEQVLINDERLLIGDDRLFAPCLLLEELIKLRKFLIIDGVHTENTEGYGCPQADEGGERKLKRINRELKEMGPQADEVRIQVSINDER
ncbi:MAG: hypothetical protein SOX54_07395 [Prevotella sp.]|nr:hypothetical protein [Prevotella sp.]